MLKDDLTLTKVWLTDLEVDFKFEVQKYYDSKSDDNRAEHEQRLNEYVFYQGRLGEKEDINPNIMSIIPDSAIQHYMMDFRNAINKQKSDYVFQFKGKKYTKDYLLNNVFVQDRDSLVDCFKFNFQLIKALVGDPKFCMNNFTLIKFKDYDGDQFDLDHLLVRKRWTNFYKYYAYFENMLKRHNIIPDNQKVRYATAHLYHESFRTNGRSEASTIYRLAYPYGEAMNVDNTDNEGLRFIDKDFKLLIENMHKRIKDTIIEQSPAVEIIQKYTHKNTKDIGLKHNNPLFYSDSPYSATIDYEDEANGVSKFTTNDMKDLITALHDSEDNFIFSCRAIVDSKRGSITDKIREGNKKIIAEVFDVFNNLFLPKNDLWVLVIITRDSKELKQDEELEAAGTPVSVDSKLIQRIQANKLIEVMITNYEIHDFMDENYKNVIFKVYNFTDFYNIVVHYANK